MTYLNMEKIIYLFIFLVIPLSSTGQIQPVSTGRITKNVILDGTRGLSERNYTAQDSMIVDSLRRGLIGSSQISENRFSTSSFSGSYLDLTDKPTIPTTVSSFTNDSGYQTSEQVISAINNVTSPISESISTLSSSYNSYTVSNNSNVSSKAPLISPSLTGVPTAPTAASSVNSTQIATTAFVKSIFADTSTDNVLRQGVAQDGTDQRSKIQALIASNKTLFFPRGVYNFTDFVKISNVFNLKIIGETGTIFTTSINKILLFSGNLSNIEVSGIKFVSTKNNAIEDPEGLLSIYEYGTGSLDGMNIHHCEFTNPNTQANAIKMVWETSNGALAMNIRVADCNFYQIGRMATEFQDHKNDGIFRIRGVKIMNNVGYLLGKYQYGELVSLTGGVKEAQICNNIITDVMGTSGSSGNMQRWAIELAGTKTICFGNIIKSKDYFMQGILNSGSDNMIIDNIIDINGGTDKTVVRGIYLYNKCSNVLVKNNHVRSEGYSLLVDNVYSCSIMDNMFISGDNNVVYLRNGATKNVITNNLFSQIFSASDNGTVIFDGTATTDNYTYLNRLVKPNGSNGSYINVNNASNNTKIFFSNEPLRLHGNNTSYPLIVSTSGGGKLDLAIMETK